ncbi:MAG TPA: Dabb family protein [Spirochaetota bacterium]|nr:Dabb family protein [Spirochaetota bacterium]
MVKHIVLWKLKDHAHGKSKRENADAIKAMIENLNGKIPGLIKLEVGFDFSCSDGSADIVLYSEFEDRKALEGYQKHPLHEEVKPYVLEARSERRVVDYEL